MVWFYLAYIVYGVAQGGSHLCWHMSGPIFARNENSAMFSSVNVVMVGIRGCIGPPLGGLLCVWLGPLVVLPFAAFLALLAAVKTWNYETKTFLAEGGEV